MQKKLIMILIILILSASAVGLGLVLYNNTKIVKVPDFTGKSISDIQNWCNTLEDKSCKIEYEYSDTVLENEIIYQSIKADEQLENSITFIISKGKEPSIELLTITNETTRVEVDKWLEETGLLYATYEYQFSKDVELDKIIKIVSDTEKVTQDSTITIYVSLGNEPSDSDEIIVKEDEFVGYTLEKFKTKTESLKLVVNHREEWDAYSSSIEKGNIVRHGSGTYEKEEKISYGLSLGKKDGSDIEVTKGAYVGYSEDDFKSKAVELGLKANHSTSRDDYSDTIEKGKIVWHGSGTYEKDETFNYGLSLGKKTDKTSVVISDLSYVGYTEENFKAKAKELGLTANHKTTLDEYSNSIAKGSVVWHGTGTYDLADSSDTWNYGLSLGPKSGSTITVSKGAYVGYSEDDFKSKANELGLKANHNSSRDDYSDTIEKGKIVWHGSGDYVSGETFNYGLSLGKKASSGRTEPITIGKGKYVGLTVSEFETKMKELGFLSIEKTSAYEDYSSTIPQGNVIWHGSGTYTASETSIRYSISKGSKTPESIPDPEPEKVAIAANTYVNKAVSEFTTFCTNNGLVAKYSSSYDDYSSTVTSGNILKHDSGSITKGSTVYYGLSKGIKTASLPGKTDINNVWVGSPVSVSNTKNIIGTKLSDKGFTNVTYVEEKNVDESIGVVTKITVNGNEHTSASSYPIDAAIVVTICNSN